MNQVGTEVEEFLEHYGVERDERNTMLAMVYQDVVDSINRHLPSINAKYKDDDLVKDSTMRKKYNQEIVASINEKILNISVFRKLSFAKAKKLTVSFNASTGMFDFETFLGDQFFMEPERDKRGFIVRVWLPEAYLEQSDMSVAEFLEHYGVKGMKWGVRRSRKQLAKEAASRDAEVSEKIRSRAKTSGTNALSNQELQTAVNRMNLESQYSRLNEQTRKKSRGEKVVNFLMKDVAEVEVKRVVRGGAAIQVEKALSKHGHEDVAKRIKPKKK